ncbi:MAG: hypothetical protein RLZ51_2387 [Pseudomonadota bacterium]|jgi:hypothetical protein
MNAPIDPKRLLTEQEVAEARGLTVGYLRDDRRGQRQIPFVQAGRAIRYRLLDVDAAIERMVCGRVKK